jgi:hypothetical protein
MPNPLSQAYDAAGDAVRKVLAYHGTPHNFDRFDASKIGSGEGAQAYGYGMYFAGAEPTAESYRKALSGAEGPWGVTINGSDAFGDAWNSLSPSHQSGATYIGLALDDARKDVIDKLPASIEDDILLAKTNWEDEAGARHVFYGDPSHSDQIWSAQHDYDKQMKSMQAALELLRDHRIQAVPPARRGHMYEVEIAHPESSFLDWEAPMSKQPKAVQRAFGDSGIDLPGDGRRVYLDTQTRLGEGFDDDATGVLAARAASDELLSEGIPGIRYLDAGSRRAGEGTRNYVMFPGTEDSISVLRKYGLLPAVGAGAAAAQQQQ